MSEIDNLVSKYKKRKKQSKPLVGGKPVNVKGRRIMGNEELTGIVHQISMITENLVKGKQEDSIRYNDLLDVLFEIEMKVHSIAKALCDQRVLKFSDIDEAKKELEIEYAEKLELNYDKQNNLFEVDREVRNGDAVILGLFAEVDGEEVKELTIERFFIENVGSGALIPAIEAEVIGIKPGKEKYIEIAVTDETLEDPKNNNLKRWLGKTLKVKINVIKVKEKRDPVKEDQLVQKPEN